MRDFKGMQLASALSGISVALMWCVIAAHAAESAPLRLLGVPVVEDGLSFQVPTGGCTSKSSLQVRLQATNPGPVEIELVRVVPDECKGLFPEGINVVFTWTELGAARDRGAKILNPFSAQR